MPAVDGRRTLPVHQLPYEPDQLGRLEGLGEKSVHTGDEAALHLVLRTRTDDRDRQMTGPWIGPQPSGGAQPVEAGHDDIERDHIGTDAMHDIQTLGTIGRGHDLEALQLEIDPDQLPNDPVVVDNENPAGRA
jgi:hypothetical protein